MCITNKNNQGSLFMASDEAHTATALQEFSEQTEASHVMSFLFHEAVSSNHDSSQDDVEENDKKRKQEVLNCGTDASAQTCVEGDSCISGRRKKRANRVNIRQEVQVIIPDIPIPKCIVLDGQEDVTRLQTHHDATNERDEFRCMKQVFIRHEIQKDSFSPCQAEEFYELENDNHQANLDLDPFHLLPQHEDEDSSSLCSFSSSVASDSTGILPFASDGLVYTSFHKNFESRDEEEVEQQSSGWNFHEKNRRDHIV